MNLKQCFLKRVVNFLFNQEKVMLDQLNQESNKTPSILINN